MECLHTTAEEKGGNFHPGAGEGQSSCSSRLAPKVIYHWGHNSCNYSQLVPVCAGGINLNK